MIFIWRKKINEIVCIGLNKRAMGHMTLMSNNCHNKISFVESYKKYLDNVKKKLVQNYLETFFLDILMINVEPLCNRMISKSYHSHITDWAPTEHCNSQIDLKHKPLVGQRNYPRATFYKLRINNMSNMPEACI